MFDLDFYPKTARDDEVVCPNCSHGRPGSRNEDGFAGIMKCNACQAWFSYMRSPFGTYHTMTIPEGEEKP